MKISYNWLKWQFKSLPSPKELEEKITFGVFEVESVEEVAGDTIIDLKVLPDRAHYALSFDGIAYEVGALIGIPYMKRKFDAISGNGNKVHIEVKDEKLCPRYMARFVGGVEAGESPTWLKEELQKIGQRSINSLVDMANYTMFTTGQPLHVFDADKLSDQKIIVRSAQKGEQIDCLDGNTYELNEDNLVITDPKDLLVVAGVKGGKIAEVTSATKNVIIESANFNPVSIRKTSAKLKLKSDAAKRYENEPTPDACSYAMDMISHLIQAENKEAVFGEINDNYPNPAKPWTVEFSKEYIESRLGRPVDDEDILGVLKMIQCEVKSSKNGVYLVEPPLFRLDLKIEDDFVEEVGRLLGYDKIKAELPPVVSKTPTVDPEFFVSEMIKDVLVDSGFSEVILYTLGKKGDIETLYPVAEDKAYLRNSILPHLEESMELNMRNADLLELGDVRIFEIGKTFDKDSERLMLGLAVGFTKKTKGNKPVDVLKEALDGLKDLARSSDAKIVQKGLVAYVELPLEVQNVEVRDSYNKIRFGKSATNMFQPFSKFPFAVRDVAVFVPNSITEKDVYAVIHKNAGYKCVRLRLFDTFRKEEKTSYAYRLVLQADDHTLTEEEINEPLNKVYEALKERGWEIR